LARSPTLSIQPIFTTYAPTAIQLSAVEGKQTLETSVIFLLLIHLALPLHDWVTSTTYALTISLASDFKLTLNLPLTIPESFNEHPNFIITVPFGETSRE